MNMDLHDLKLGDEIPIKQLGAAAEAIGGKKFRLLKVTYFIQCEEGGEVSVSALHKDYQEPEQT